MEPSEAIENLCRMENDDNVGLSDIIDILNTLDNQNQQQTAVLNGTASPLATTRANNAPAGAAVQAVAAAAAASASASAPAPAIATATSASTATRAIAAVTKTALPHPLHQSSSSPLLGQTSTLLGTQQVLTNSNSHSTVQSGRSVSGSSGGVQKPYIKIVEQPASKALRFRYECEGRSAGSIPGVNSTPENKTYPTIEIMGYKGDVVVVVSCVTKDPPYRPHPHNLVGKESCKNGICTLVLNGEPLRAVFSNLGIQCVKKKDIRAALETRESMQVDPFKTKFAHKDQPSSIDLNAVRLCFQAFLKMSSGVKPLTPVVSDPIYDKKAMSDLVICRLCSCAAKVGGGDEIILLCEKIAKDDIKVKFYEQNGDGKIIWEDYADFHQTDIHKQTAIAFRTPRYHNTDIVDRAKVFLQLVRPSDGVTSEPLPFEYYPDPDQIKRKRLKTGGSPMNILKRELQKHEQLQNAHIQTEFKDIPTTTVNNVNIWNTPFMTDIKTEPAMSPQHFGPHRSPFQMSPSPQPLSPMNRNSLTPSPGLMKTPSAGSQTQMNDLYNYATLKTQMGTMAFNALSPSTASTTSNNGTSQPYLNGNNNSTNPFLSNMSGGAVIATDDNKFVTVSRSSSNSSINHMAKGTRTSGGSITPLWPADANSPNSQNPFNQFLSISPTQTTGTQLSPMLIQPQQQLQTQQQQLQTQQQQLQTQQQQLQTQPLQQYYQQHQQPQQQHQMLQSELPTQLPNDIDILASTEEGPTLSGLLAFMDTEQLMPINTDELQLSNLSITT